MLVTEAQAITSEAIRDHFDALSVELLGIAAAGLPRERIEELIERGRLSIDALTGLDAGELSEPLNPVLFIRLLGTPYAEADPQTRAQMRTWALDKWARELQNPLSARIDQDTGAIDISPPPFTFDRPEPPEDTSYTPTPRPFPSWLNQAERAGILSAYEHTGRFIRGLGNTLIDEARGIIAEEWASERLLSTPDPARRNAALEILREEIATATLTRDTAQTAARRIRQRTGDLARNFERIAETELQAAHNDGIMYQAAYIDGNEARVARIPESGACRHCLRLFLNSEGRPVIFSVSELAANGTNVGRKAADYLPTAYPLHPNCRCDTIPIRAGQAATREGRLIKESDI